MLLSWEAIRESECGDALFDSAERAQGSVGVCSTPENDTVDLRNGQSWMRACHDGAQAWAAGFKAGQSRGMNRLQRYGKQGLRLALSTKLARDKLCELHTLPSAHHVPGVAALRVL